MGSVEQYHANQEQALLAQAKAAGILRTPTGLGGAREQLLSDYLAKHLPARLSVERGEVIDQRTLVR